MKKILLSGMVFLALSASSSRMYAQTTTPAVTTPAVVTPADDDKITFKFSGFVNSQAMFDTRQTLNSRETMMVYYPLGFKAGKDGSDLNARPNFDQLAMTTRLRATISGPTILGAKAIGVIESDFTGASNAENNSLRLRHAYIKLNWAKDELLIGQYWHPLDVPEMLPNMTSLNTGAPFHPFSRHIQVRYSHTFFDKLTLVGVAASQRDYANDGPDYADSTKTVANSSQFQRNAIIPDLDFQVQYKAGCLFLGAGADYKTLRPRLYTTKGYDNPDLIKSYAATVFANIMLKAVDIKFQAVWGQNMSDHQMIGGYADASYAPITREVTYTNINTGAAWLNIWTKREHFNFGVFAGYTKNLGSDASIVAGGLKYGRGFDKTMGDVAYIYRVSPMASYTYKNFKVTAEIEYTVAAYGLADANESIAKSTEYKNIRALLAAYYNF